MFCVLCKGTMSYGKVNFPVDAGKTFVLVKDVPAYVCEQCGEYFLEDTVAEAVEKIAHNARNSVSEIEILRYAA